MQCFVNIILSINEYLEPINPGQDYYLGGMRMLDFKHVVASAQLHWLQKYLTFKEKDWHVMFEYFLNVENPVLYIPSNYSTKELSSNTPDYYKATKSVSIYGK